MPVFSQGDLVAVTREVETTPGVVTGGARDRVYGTAPTMTPSGEIITSGINTGEGEVHSVRAGLRSADAEIPSELVYLLNHPELEDVLRDSFPASEATATDVAVTFAQAGSQDSGATGPTIVGAAGDFSDFLTCAGCMLETSSGAADPANTRPRAILAVSADGSQIDLEPDYTSGSVGEISEPLVDEGPVTCTFRAGKVIRNQGVKQIRTVNFEFEFTDHQDGGTSSFLMARGQYAATLRIQGDGKGNVTLTVTYVGMDFDVPTDVTQGDGTVNPNPGIDNPSINFGEDLSYFLVGATTQLAGDNLTNFSLDGNGNASGIDDTAGSRNRVGVTVGDMVFTGSLTLLHEHIKAKLISNLSHAGNLVPVDMKLADPAGNFYWLRLPRVLFEASAPKPSGKGSRVEGAFNWSAQKGPDGIRSFIIQAFSA